MAWNQSTGAAAKPQPKKPSALRGVIAGVVCAGLAAAVALFVMSGKDEKPKANAEKAAGLIKEVEPAAAPKVSPTNVVEKVETDPAKIRVKTVSCTTNGATGQVCDIYYTADGKKHREYRPSRPPAFKHMTDVLLAMTLCQPDGVSIPPLPSGGGGDNASRDKAFLASLKEPIVISPDDSEAIVARKKRVIEAREQVKEMMDQGLHFNDILAEHVKLFNENVQIRNKAMHELNQIHEKGDKVGETVYQAMINKSLRQMGIPELDTPMTREELVAAKAAARAQKRLEREKKK